MPEFIPFLFPLGFRSYKQDFYFSGFAHRTELAPKSTLMEKRFQICFSLKSVEPSDSDDWSIRHCAVHHSFDLTKVRTNWAVVKGDELMKRRIESAMSDRGPLEVSDFTSVSRALEASLKTHLIFCNWSAENWRYYINSLEDKFQNMTRRTFSAPLNVPFLPAADMDRFQPNARTDTQRTERSMFSFSRAQTQITEKMSFKTAPHRPAPIPKTHTNPDTGITQPLPPDDDDNDDDDDDDDEPENHLKSDHDKEEDENRDFSFGKLRKVHQSAEKANEALLVLKQNVIVLAQMRKYYTSILRRKNFPKDLAEHCGDAIDDFALCVEGLEDDMQTQILRLEMLLRLLEDRKTLVKQIMQSRSSAELNPLLQLHSILDYQNTRANKYSTKSMVTMTEDMNDIARKTKIETVSMKVITLVTLFFLPGTFISVSLLSPLSCNRVAADRHKADVTINFHRP